MDRDCLTRFFISAKADDTEYFEPNDDDTFQEICRDSVTKEQFPVIRRRSLSVGSKPLKTSSMYETVLSDTSRFEIFIFFRFFSCKHNSIIFSLTAL